MRLLELTGAGPQVSVRRLRARAGTPAQPCYGRARKMVRDEREVTDALRAGDEVVFARLVATHQPGFVRAARVWVNDADAAREVVQATWLATPRELGGLCRRCP